MSSVPVNTSKAQEGPHGPCLYFGPGGERCGREAHANGYCSRHDPEGAPIAAGIPAKRFWALVGATAVLWPVLVDLIRVLIRWLR